MNDTSDTQYGKSSSTTQGQNSDDNRLTAETYDEFFDALDLLYIKANMGGRLKFLENWPNAAKYIFGDELIGFDHDGTRDIERRSVLEDEAEERRLALLEIVETLEARSVERSVLQVEYVEGVVTKMGRELALLLYAPKIVSRFIPDVEGVAAEAVAKVVKPAGNEIPDPYQEAVPQKPIVPEFDDHLDSVQPISLDQPSPPKPRPEQLAAPAPDVPTPTDVPVPEIADVLLERPADPPIAPPLYDDAPKEPAPLSQPLEAEDRPVEAPPFSEPTAPPVSSPPPEEFLQKPESLAPSDPTVQDSSKSSMHKALDGQEPIASQKMTFMPAKAPAEKKASLNEGVVPVIGGNKDPKD